MHSHRKEARRQVALVGGESLLGREVRELLEESGLGVDVKLLASDDGVGSIIAPGRKEPVVINALEVADLATSRMVILAGSPESSQKAYQQIRGAKTAPVVIDLNGGLEELPETRLRAPQVEPAGFEAGGAIQVIAHPAAIALALFLIQLQKASPIRRSVVEIFEPASERGQAGLDELQKQTVGLLSLKPLPKEVFDAQVSFNMLVEYGSESPHSLGDIELKIDRHLASLLGSAGAAPMPSLRLIHTPVFHGYNISVWAELEDNPGVEALSQAIGSNRIEVRGSDVEPPTNVGVAGQGGITVGGIAADRNHPRACWFWIVADNFRIAAENALEVARGFLA
jgi:aspartate-semialdehyde dehydrogenase